MNRIYACIDGRAHSDAVVDWAAWAALRMALPLEFLHVLERHPERATAADFSGAIGPDAQGSLLRALSEEDARRSKLAREAGRATLAAARERAAAAGPLELDARLRHGELVATVTELASDAALIVLGEHPQTSAQARVHADHHLERIVRTVRSPVLVANTHTFAAPQRVVLAFDGSANARQAAQALVSHPLTAGLPVLLAMAGSGTAKAKAALEQAGNTLAAHGLMVQTTCLPGDAQHVLPELTATQGPALLAMGAYGHSRLRQFVLGSTTRALLCMPGTPVLILR